VFATSGFMVMWTNWPQTRTAAIFPLVFWSIERVLQDRTWSSAAWFGLALAAMFLGGFPAIAVHAMYLGAAYAVVRWFALRAGGPSADAPPLGRPVALLVAGGLAALALTAFQLVPWAVVLSSVDLSYRADHWREVLPSGSLLTTAFPLARGSCGTEIPAWGAVNPVEGISFIGSAAVLIAVAALSSSPPRQARGARTFFLSAACFALVVSFVGGPINYVFQLFPLVGNNSLHRIRAVGALMIAMLVAMGYDALRRSRPVGGGRVLAWTAVVLWPVLVVVMARQTRAGVPNTEAWYALRPSLVLGIAAAWLTAGLWAATLLVRRRGAARVVSRVVAVVLPGLVLVEALVFTGAFWARTDPSTLYPPTATSAFLQRNLGTDRYVGYDEAYWRGAGRIDGLRSLDGHAFVTPEWAALLQMADPEFFETGTSQTLSSLDTINSPVFDRLATRYVVADLADPVAGSIDAEQSWTEETVELAGRVARRTVGGGERLRALVIHVPTRPANVADGRLLARLTDASGETVASAERRLRPEDEGVVEVPVAGERLRPGEDLVAELTVEGSDGLAVSATDAGEPWLGFVLARPDDRTVLLTTGDAQVYERPDAMGRFRWASSARQCASTVACAQMMTGLAPTTVLLDPDVAPAFEGRPAELTVEVDQDDLKRVGVEAEGAGMLVLAEAVQDGWVARVDGARVPIHRADGALMGVAVPAGRHVVELGYEPVGWKVLPAVAGVAFVATLVVLAWSWVAGRRSGSRGGGPARR
jgi:hypothetical protein